MAQMPRFFRKSATPDEKGEKERIHDSGVNMHGGTGESRQ